MGSNRLHHLPFLVMLAAAIAPVTAARADEAGPPVTQPEDRSAGGAHEDPHSSADGDVIVVTGHLPTDLGLLAGSVSIEGDTLVAQSRGQIGEVLASLPGVSASSFAPGVSRPVLRGFDGDRISVLTDGIGSIDASSVSADHAVVFDTLTVDHVDVVHGPAVLLFGGQAIGGAVNALDKRIPRRVPGTITGSGIGGYATAAKERSIGSAIDVPLSDRFVAHIDANWRKSDDMRTGGRIVSSALRAELLAEADTHGADGDQAEAEELEEAAFARGRIANSAARSLTLGAGLAFIDAGGNLGVSVQRFDTHYGVPLRPGLDHGEEGNSDSEAAHGDGVAIDLVQTRIDMRGAVALGGFFEELQVRGAFGDYRHVEIEGGEPGTRFAGKGLEFRADLVQPERGAWRGRSGVHHFSRRMTVEGAEAIIPNNSVERTGVFTLQSLKVGRGIEIELAGRYEIASVRTVAPGFSRHFDLWSGAAGVSWVPAAGWKLGINHVRGARAPSPEELLSDGVHVATQAYEQGDATFATERSRGFEAYVRYTGRRAELSLTGFATHFDNFIAAIPTGEEREGFPLFRYRQLPARYIGFEASGSVEVAKWGDNSLRLDLASDYTRARLSGVGPAPRIPPLRVRGGAELKLGDLRLHGEVEWNDRQNRVAAFENPVAAFTQVDLGADWHPFGEDGPLTLLLSASNIFDTVGRRAASFTRDFVPLPGRDVRMTVKMDF